MTPPESTEPGAADLSAMEDDVIETCAKAAFEGNRLNGRGGHWHHALDTAQRTYRHSTRSVIRSLIDQGFTITRAPIAPTEPGRVCLTWETACDMASWEDHFDMMDVERFREYISGPLKAAIAAAERGASGGNGE